MKSFRHRAAVSFPVAISILGFVFTFAKPARADAISIVFRDGPPPPNVALIVPTTATSQVDFSGGRMNINLANTNDAVQIQATIFNPACWIFRGVSLGLPPNGAISFGFITGDEINSVSVGLLIANTTPSDSLGVSSADDPILKVNVFTEVIVGGIPRLIPQPEPQTFSVTQEQLDRLDHIRIDCVGPGQVVFEFSIRGLFNDFERTVAIPGLCLEGQRGFIRNIAQPAGPDPPVSARVDSLDLDTVHTPEPTTLVLLGTALTALALRIHRQPK